MDDAEGAGVLVISPLFAGAILGGVGEAGFNRGPIKMGGSAAVLIGGAYLFNMLLEPQLADTELQT